MRKKELELENNILKIQNATYNKILKKIIEAYEESE